MNTTLNPNAVADGHEFVSHAGPAANSLTLLSYGARGVWSDTTDLIRTMHAENGDALAQVFTVFYQMIKHNGRNAADPGETNADARDRIARSLSLLGREEYAAVRVADVLLHRLAVDDTPGFADEWDGVRFAFGGRNVVPVAAAVLMITLGALEPEDKDAVVLLDRLTTDGAFTQVLQSFGMGNAPVTPTG